MRFLSTLIEHLVAMAAAFLDRLFGGPGNNAELPDPCAASRIARGLNDNALIAFENGHVVAIEDHNDPDGRMYRLEYRSTQDGRHAVGYCLSNPWNRRERNDGVGFSTGHVASDGFLCLGSRATRDVASSPFDLDYVIRRSRYWCTAFSVYKETDEFPNM